MIVLHAKQSNDISEGDFYEVFRRNTRFVKKSSTNIGTTMNLGVTFHCKLNMIFGSRSTDTNEEGEQENQRQVRQRGMR